MDVVPTLDTMTVFYTGGGNCMVEIGKFTKCPKGVVLLEHTTNGGASWQPFNATKVGRGMTTNAIDSGPAIFRGQLEGGRAAGLRVRCQDTLEMEQISVQITFAGGIVRHYIRGEPHYTIQEVPDLRDLLR